MSGRQDGGPAFSMSEGHPFGGVHHVEGMSLRAWLAGQALAGLLSNPNKDVRNTDASALALSHADKMLEALDAE